MTRASKLTPWSERLRTRRDAEHDALRPRALVVQRGAVGGPLLRRPSTSHPPASRHRTPAGGGSGRRGQGTTAGERSSASLSSFRNSSSAGGARGGRGRCRAGAAAGRRRRSPSAGRGGPSGRARRASGRSRRGAPACPGHGAARSSTASVDTNSVRTLTMTTRRSTSPSSASDAPRTAISPGRRRPRRTRDECRSAGPPGTRRARGASTRLDARILCPATDRADDRGGRAVSSSQQIHTAAGIGVRSATTPDAGRTIRCRRRMSPAGAARYPAGQVQRPTSAIEARTSARISGNRMMATGSPRRGDLGAVEVAHPQRGGVIDRQPPGPPQRGDHLVGTAQHDDRRRRRRRALLATPEA